MTSACRCRPKNPAGSNELTTSVLKLKNRCSRHLFRAGSAPRRCCPATARRLWCASHTLNLAGAPTGSTAEGTSLTRALRCFQVPYTRELRESKLTRANSRASRATLMCRGGCLGVQRCCVIVASLPKFLLGAATIGLCRRVTCREVLGVLK